MHVSNQDLVKPVLSCDDVPGVCSVYNKVRVDYDVLPELRQNRLYLGSAVFL